MRASTLILLALDAAAVPAAAQDKKPFVEPGTQPQPWETAGEPKGPRPGDLWADLRLEVDKRGYPTRCGILRTDIRDPEMRFWICHAFMQDWHIEPLMQAGKPVPQVVTRHFVLQGIRHPR